MGKTFCACFEIICQNISIWSQKLCYLKNIAKFWREKAHLVWGGLRETKEVF